VNESVATQQSRSIEAIVTGNSGTMSGVIVHLGAGGCRELPGYLQEPAARVVLVEADPEQARELRRRARGNDRVEVIAAAVTPVAGVARLKRFRLKCLNSLRVPTGIHELYPGLRLQDEIEVKAITPRELIESYELRAEQGNRLIIDTPGEESAIVHALRESDHLLVFERIDLYCGDGEHYKGSGNAEAALRYLELEGYEVEACGEAFDPDRPRWSLRWNRYRLESRLLREQLSEVTSERDMLKQQLFEKIVEIKQLQISSRDLRDCASDLEVRAAEAERDQQEQARIIGELKCQIADISADKRNAFEQISSVQDKVNNEISRAEAQLSLIKDLLIHGVQTNPESVS
jgi:FkbM family methyltransferase